jgi:signal transduction histidine kinase
VTVTLSEMPGWADFPGVHMTVDDQGEGIAEEIRQRVFTKFWKHGARGGSGLGMYLVNGLVKAHGGMLDIDDAPGGGARIAIAWPTVDERPE